MPLPSYSPQETAAITGAPLASIQRAITRQAIPARALGKTGRRQLNETALLAFALLEALPAEVRLSPATVYNLLREDPQRRDVVLGEVVRIDTAKALEGTRRRLALYDRAADIIVKDPAILGGAPVIKGTRITAQSILGRLEAGDDVDSILEDYPALDRDTLEVAALYAKANPLRGRPSGKLWPRAS